MNPEPIPPLLPAPAPAKPHPIDVALAALSQLTAELLVSDKSSRFAEVRTIAMIAVQIQRLRPIAGVDDVALYDEDEDGVFPVRRRHHVRFNDGADLNTQILMMAQSFLEKYADIEKLKAKPSSSRMTEVMELSELIGLRSRLREDKEDVPDAINNRINHLVQRIGEPPPSQDVENQPANEEPDASLQQQR